MDARSKIINAEIARHASTMGESLGEKFAACCRSSMAQSVLQTETSEHDIATTIAAFSTLFTDGVTASELATQIVSNQKTVFGMQHQAQ